MATDTAAGPLPAKSDTAFLGHPVGLAWLSASEFWERFSYYGMISLLVLYMTHSLLLPGHVEHIAGFSLFRRVIEWFTGKLSPQALASQINGLYQGTVYLTPLAGGLIADRLTGRTRAVIIGATLMAAGHLLMTFDATFLLAMACLLAGVGFFKGNIASQVGALYSKDDPRRADGYQVFMLGIQIAVIFSPFLCGRLAQWYGWSYGFALPAAGMAIGLVVYLSGRRTLPKDDTAPAAATATAPTQTKPKVTAAEWKVIAVLVLLLPVLAVAQVGNSEIFNAYLIWGEKNYQLTILGLTMPITDLLSYGSIVSALTIMGSVAFWRWYGERWAEPDEITKITIGVAIASLAPLMLVAASALEAVSGHKASLGWAVGFEFVNDIGFANLFPIALALYSRAAPRHLTGVIIGVFYLHLFIGNTFTGWLGGLLEKMPATSFWLLHVVLMIGAAAALLVVKLLFGRMLAPAYAAPKEDAAAA